MKESIVEKLKMARRDYTDDFVTTEVELTVQEINFLLNLLQDSN